MHTLREYISRGGGIRRWTQHGRDPLSNLGGDSGPYRTRPKPNTMAVVCYHGTVSRTAGGSTWAVS